MRLLVLFDLPTSTTSERRLATRFRNYLLNDGFNMLQHSVYTRLCPNRDIAEKHKIRIIKNSPANGSVRIINLTENQFTSMYIVVGEKTIEEQHLPAKQMVFF